MKKIYFLALSIVGLISQSNAQYCTGGPSSTFDSNIGSVVISGDNGSGFTYTGCPGVTGVEDSTATHVVNLTPAQSYSMDVTFSTCGGTYSGAGEAWIDFNANQVFEASESIGTWSGTPTQTVTFNFTVPTNAIPGFTRMRVMQRESGSLPLDPCGSFTWGSVVDFGVNIAPLSIPNNFTAISAYTLDSNLCPENDIMLNFIFKNSSNDTISAGTNLNLGFIAASQSVTETYTAANNIMPGDTIDYMFTTPYTVQNGVNSINFYVNFALDSLNLDDSTTFTFNSDAVPATSDIAICIGDSATLSVNGAGSYIWYDSNMNQIGTGQQITVGPLTASTTYYVSFAGSKKWFIDTAYTSGYAVDHNTYTGDDRGGIAVTRDYVYINGDGNIVRYNAADMTNPVVLPQNDGLFSDLYDGQLYALFDTVSNNYVQGTYISSDSINAIVKLDEMLNPIDTILLSQQINIASTTNKGGVFAGSGYLILYSGGTNGTFYRIGLPSGNVINLGTYALTGLESSENWANWGIADSIAGDYYVIYKPSTSESIERMNLTTYATKTIQNNYSDLGNMHSITYSPWLKRIYFHNEYNNHWGSFSEAGGYIEANHISFGVLTPYGNCMSETYVEVQNPQVNLGPDTVANQGYVLDAGPGFVNYYWSTGETTQTITVNGSGAYSVTVVTSAGCVASDAVFIIITGIEELAAQFGAKVYPNPSAGQFTIQLPNNRMALQAVITDMTGKVVYSESLTNQTTYTVNLEGTAKGVYFLQLTDGQKTVTQKLIIK